MGLTRFLDDLGIMHLMYVYIFYCSINVTSISSRPLSPGRPPQVARIKSLALHNPPQTVCKGPLHPCDLIEPKLICVLHT